MAYPYSYASVRRFVRRLKRRHPTLVDLLEHPLASSTVDGADDHIERLAQRYTGAPYRNPKIDRLIVHIDPVRVTGGEGGNAWDVT